MKKLVALAVAAAITSPLALAANTPDNVGDVTYLGNIVANSPMWQWTVNDYPGGRLDAKPSTATTANGTTTYPLNGQAFIAVSGYLPGHAGITAKTQTTIGFRDITSLTGQDGSAIEVTSSGETNGTVVINIPALAKNLAGEDTPAILKLKALDLRANRIARGGKLAAGGEWAYNTLYVVGGGMVTPGGSCFTGGGDWSGVTINGTSIAPSASGLSTAAWSGLLATIELSKDTGSVDPAILTDPRWSSNNVYLNTEWGCDKSTATGEEHGTVANSYDTKFLGAGRVLELAPVSLSAGTPLSGAWNSTLTVTAYTM